MSIRARLNLFLAVLAILLIAGVGVASRYYGQAAVRQQLADKADLVMDVATGLRDYTAKEVVPLLQDRLKTQFLPHSVPSWAAQTQLRALGKDYNGLSYKEAALDPTNPDDRADDWEAGIIKRFRDNPVATEFEDVAQVAGKRQYVLAKAIRITDKGCLVCHSVPSAAPSQMVDLYGDQNGFNWKLGDIVGARIVYVPFRDDEAGRMFMTATGLTAIASLLFVLAANVVVSGSAIGPLSRLTSRANEIAIDATRAEEFDGRGSSDAAGLAEALNRMKRNLTRS